MFYLFLALVIVVAVVEYQRYTKCSYDNWIKELPVARALSTTTRRHRRG